MEGLISRKSGRSSALNPTSNFRILTLLYVDRSSLNYHGESYRNGIKTCDSDAVNTLSVRKDTQSGFRLATILDKISKDYPRIAPGMSSLEISLYFKIANISAISGRFKHFESGDGFCMRKEG